MTKMESGANGSSVFQFRIADAESRHPAPTDSRARSEPFILSIVPRSLKLDPANT